MAILRRFCTAKLHGVTVTGADPDYEGSIGISAELLKASGIAESEMVQITNFRNAALWQTYVISLNEPGQIVLNGPPACEAADLFRVGDKVVVLTWTLMTLDVARAGRYPFVVHVEQRDGNPNAIVSTVRTLRTA